MDPALFIELNFQAVAFLLVVGFIGGLVSGLIGSGGAFVLTPGMMSLGVPGVVAVASNICHKFPKALVGAIKRHEYGQVDIKLGLVMASRAALGMWWGSGIQKSVRATWGEAGSYLYVSGAFVIVLTIVGLFVLRDAVKRPADAGRDDRSGGARRPRRARIRPGPAVRVPGPSLRPC